MWGKNDDDKNPVSANNRNLTTLIAGGTEVQGDVHFRGNVHLEGVVRGNISSDDGVLQLSEGSSVEGNIRATHIVINGRVTGDVYATERLELSSGAEIQGNIYYDVMEMQAGASISGQIERMHKSGELLPKDEEKEEKEEDVKQLENA
ncbi:MAG: bactofilin family protein [Endozoicomonas sp.]